MSLEAGVIRTQVQLSAEQAKALRAVAARRRVSLAELIRQGVDRVLEEDTRAEQYRRAAALLGRFHDEAADVAEHHDKYLEEAYR